MGEGRRSHCNYYYLPIQIVAIIIVSARTPSVCQYVLCSGRRENLTVFCTPELLHLEIIMDIIYGSNRACACVWVVRWRKKKIKNLNIQASMLGVTGAMFVPCACESDILLVAAL